MLPNRIGLMTAIISLTVLGCGNPEAINSSPSPNSLLTTTPTSKTTASPTVTSETSKPKPSASAKESAKESAKAIAVGDIKEIEDNSICGKSKITYAYGETSNYRVYICADTNAPDRPRYYISRNKDGSGGLDLEAMNYNPQKSGRIEFKNDGYIYTLESPTTQNPEPVLRVTFPNGKLSEEQLLRYLSRSSTSTSSTTNATPLEYVLQNRENLGVCKDNFRAEDGTRGMGSRVFQLSDTKYLVQIQCFLAAYQGAFEYVLWIDESPKPRAIPLEFDSFQEGKGGEKPKRFSDRGIAGAPRVNVRSQTITNFTKFRGLGDCGSSASYKLEGDRMVLQEFRAKYECDGKYVQDFPLIYP
jgi:hypothetical protein